MIFFFVLSEAHTVSRTMVANSEGRNKSTLQLLMKRKATPHKSFFKFLRVHYNASIAKFLGAYKQLTRHICPAPAQAALQAASVASKAAAEMTKTLVSTTDNKYNGGGRVCPNEQHLLDSSVNGVSKATLASTNTILVMPRTMKCPTCGAATRRTKKARLTLLEAEFGPITLLCGRMIYTKFEKAVVAKTITIDTCGHCNPLESENLWCSDIVWEYRKTDPHLLVVTWKDREDPKKEVTLLATSQEKAKKNWALSICCLKRVCLAAREYNHFYGNCFTCR